MTDLVYLGEIAGSDGIDTAIVWPDSERLAPFLGNPEAEREIGASLVHVSGKVWVVALLDGEPAGCAAVFLGRVAELTSAYVLPERRCRGAYSALVSARLALAGSRPVVATCRPRAAETLARRGFVEIGRRGEYAVVRRGQLA